MIAPTSRKIGKYEILRKLGRGGMADVYLAHDTENGDAVALKLIEHAADADTIAAIEAERRGAELQAHLAAIDPRVVRVYESGDADGFFFVAMEYIDGQDLAELMRRGPLATGFATDVAIAVAKTLDNAHNLSIDIGGKDFHGVVHGDIKPKNIRIDARGEVRVLDFGIAKALSLSRRLTRNEFGSVPYASPERLDFGRSQCRLGPVVAGRDALRDGHGDAAVSGREHGAAGAHDPLADRAASGARPLSRTAAPHPDEGDGARSGAALCIGARVRRRPGGIPRGYARGRDERGSGRHAAHVPSRATMRTAARRGARRCPATADRERRREGPRAMPREGRPLRCLRRQPGGSPAPSASPCGRFCFCCSPVCCMAGGC